MALRDVSFARSGGCCRCVARIDDPGGPYWELAFVAPPSAVPPLRVLCDAAVAPSDLRLGEVVVIVEGGVLRFTEADVWPELHVGRVMRRFVINKEKNSGVYPGR